MAYFGASNQLIQIDTGKARTYLYNKSLSAIQVYADIGEVQVLGQRYCSVTNATAANPYGAPAIYELVKYLSTSALTTANLTTFGGPVPVWWTDNTFTTVTAISSEALSLNIPAGYMVLNIVDLPTLTAAMVLGAQLLVQVGGYLKGAYMSASAGTAGIGNFIEPYAGTGTTQSVAAGTPLGYNKFGTQLTAISAGLCDVLVDADIF
jgi:hypothetical protein